MTVPEKLSALRACMKSEGIDAWLVPTDDFHGSEYVGGYFKCREFLTGFTGSAGTALVTVDGAYLWTDGRYFLQAAQQLEGTGVTLMKIDAEGVPTIGEYLEENLKQGQVLGFDGRCMKAAAAKDLFRKLESRGIAWKVRAGGKPLDLRAGLGAGRMLGGKEPRGKASDAPGGDGERVVRISPHHVAG